MDDVRWLDDREQRAWRGLQMMQMRLDGELARRLAADSELSYSDYAVLVELTDEPDGRCRAFELGKALGWEKSRLSHHVSRMEGRGLVEKVRCDEDRRGSYVAITEHGRRCIEAAAPGHLDAVRELFVDRLTAEQLEILGDITEAVLSAVEDPPCVE